MTMKVWFACVFAAMMFVVSAQEATEPVTVMVAESEEHGSYLTDSEGRTLYLFVNEELTSEDPERMTEGVRANAAPCVEGCLAA